MANETPESARLAAPIDADNAQASITEGLLARSPSTAPRT